MSRTQLYFLSVSNQQEILNDATSPTSTIVGAFGLPSVHNKRHEPYQEDLYEADKNLNQHYKLFKTRILLHFQSDFL